MSILGHYTQFRRRTRVRISQPTTDFSNILCIGSGEVFGALAEALDSGTRCGATRVLSFAEKEVYRREATLAKHREKLETQ